MLLHTEAFTHKSETASATRNAAGGLLGTKLTVATSEQFREKSWALGRSPNDGRLAVDPDYGMIAGRSVSSSSEYGSRKKIVGE